MAAVGELPASPLSIALSLSHRRLWWQIDDEDHMPERWDVSADVCELAACRDELRHVGDLSLVIADLRRERNLLDTADLGEWALEFIAETVIDPAAGLLHPELDAQLGTGPPRMVIIRRVELAEPWRGHRLAAALIAGALRTLSASARVGACRVSPLEFLSATDNRITAEFACARIGAMLKGIGFRPWRGVHIVDLRDPALLDARLSMLQDEDRAGEGRAMGA